METVPSVSVTYGQTLADKILRRDHISVHLSDAFGGSFAIVHKTLNV